MGRNAHFRAERDKFMYDKAEKYAAIFEREKKQHDIWQSLSIKLQCAANNAERVRKSPQDRAIAATTVCQLPLCDRPVIEYAGQSLGVCYPHGADIAIYFDAHGEDFKQQVARVERFETAARRDRLAERRAESRRLHPGWIYYVLIDGRIKIGYSVDVKRRLASYPFDSPLLAMHPGTKQLEAEMHKKFAGSRAAGREWFLDTDELRTHINEVIAQFGEPDRARYERRGRRRSSMRAAPPKPTGISR